MSTMAGLHVPVMPSVDVLVNTGTLPLAQIAADIPNANVGVAFGVMVTLKDAGTAHSPAVGVNV